MDQSAKGSVICQCFDGEQLCLLGLILAVASFAVFLPAKATELGSAGPELGTGAANLQPDWILPKNFFNSTILAVSPGGPETRDTMSTNGKPDGGGFQSPVKPPNPEPKEKPHWWDIVAAISAAVAAIFAAYATQQTRKASRSAELAARAQRLADLWPDMQKLRFLEAAKVANPDKDTSDIVLINVNTMEKIAFCWNADLVDRQSVEKEMGRSYLKLYDQIQKVPHMPELQRSGAELLAQNPLAKVFHDYLEKASEQSSNPKPTL